jgi:DNA helicase IV
MLPVWARKPNSKKELVATEKGWTVKETGEVIRSCKNLDKRLLELKEEIVEITTENLQTEPLSDSTEQVNTTHTEEEKTLIDENRDDLTDVLKDVEEASQKASLSDSKSEGDVAQTEEVKDAEKGSKSSAGRSKTKRRGRPRKQK